MRFVRAALKIGLTGVLAGAAACAADSAPDAEESLVDEEPPVLEETHLVILECDIELACDTISAFIEVGPPDAWACAVQHFEASEPGLIEVIQVAGGGFVDRPSEHSASFVMSDGGIIRQRRPLACVPGSFCQEHMWGPWGPHEICELETFSLDGAWQSCEEVADFSCEELAEMLSP